MKRSKKALYYIFGILLMILITAIAYRIYIQKNYFEIVTTQIQYSDYEFTYNSWNYGFVEGGYYELVRNGELVHISKDGSISPFSIQGEVVFNHDGQLFLRDLDRIYEVTDESINYLFNEDSIRYAKKVDNKVYYVTYSPRRELFQYDIGTGEKRSISRIERNPFSNNFDYGYEFLVEDKWLIYEYVNSNSNGIALYNLDSEESVSIFEINPDEYDYSNVLAEEIKYVNGKIYYKINEYSDFPSYGVDDIGGNGDGYDYCYVIESGKTFRGKLKETVIYSEPVNLKDKYQLDYIVDLSDKELDDLFGYIEPPILIEPNKSEFELEDFETELFTFETNTQMEIIYSFNEPNAIKYGILFTEPFLIPLGRDITKLYYYSIDKKTGKHSQIIERDFYMN